MHIRFQLNRFGAPKNDWNFDKKDLYSNILERYSNIKVELQVLEMSHWIRMFKYHPDPNKVKFEIECLYESFKN